MSTIALKEILSALHRCIPSLNKGNLDAANSCATDITQICLYETSDKDIDLCCSVLFDKTDGLIAYLSKIVSIDELQSCKANLLDFLSRFIQRVGKKILPYAVDIKDLCVSLFLRDRFAKVKNGVFPVLTKLLELSVGSQVADDMNLPKLRDKYFMELTKASKHTASVKNGIYVLLGVLAEIYPEHMVGYADRLTGLYVNALKAEMHAKSRKPELPIIAGCLEGLSCCLVNFTQAADEGSQYCQDILRYARSAINPNVELARYDVPRAGLKVFSKHASQFSKYLIDDYEGMYDRLTYWSRHHNRENMHLGISAMEAFLNQVSEMLVQKAKEGKTEGAIFKFFLKKFRTIMDDTNASSKEISVAIQGYGMLAAPCHMFLSQADVQYMLTEMLHKSEQYFLSQSEGFEDHLYSLPSYLIALANIIKEVDQMSDTSIGSLERLLVILIENYPVLNTSVHFICSKSVIRVLLALQPKGASFSQLLTNTVYQGLIRTCSHPVDLETEQQTNEELTSPLGQSERKITYKDHMELWMSLLDSPQIKDLAVVGISVEERTRLTEAVYDEIMLAVMRVINKLDLSSTMSQSEQVVLAEASGSSTDIDNEDISADPVFGIQANKPKDFQVFINLVNFCRDLFPEKHWELFDKWVFPFGHAIVVMATQCPLVSGFYKVLAVCMKVATKLEYFKGIAVDVEAPESQQNEKMDVDQDLTTADRTQKQTCYLLFMKFAKEVLVRMKQFRDDLLASCLGFILSLPKEIISCLIRDVVPALQTTFAVGLSYLPLASIGLDALEYWSLNLPVSVLEPYYKDILPSLDNYLKTPDHGAEDVAVGSVIEVKGGRATSRGRKKLPVRLVKGKAADTASKSYVSQLSILKQRILHYLGSLGGSVNHALLAHTEHVIGQKAVTWDTMRHLKFSVPFQDMKPTIYFDPFLPHIVDLATSSSDRQTKVAACELLHSLVLYSLGRGAQQPGETQSKYPMERIYRKLFPVILQLACDVEQVAKQLFEPLILQLIHWFTGNRKAESEETMALLDTIFDGIVQPKDTALRDLSARCLKEFLFWSIKQTSKKQQEKNPINAKSVLKRLYSFALHPSAFKRLGAALAFNNIYTVFREEQSLVDCFTFEILKHFVDSLALAHADEKSLGTQEHCGKALSHLERIITVKADLLRDKTKHRVVPSDWSTGTVEIAVRWLLQQCGRPQTECRHVCMRLVYQLAPLIKGIPSVNVFFSSFLTSRGKDYFIERFERGGHVSGDGGLSKFPHLSDISDCFSLTTTLSWFDLFLAALDCYAWVFGQQLLPPNLLTGKSNVFKAVSYFLEQLAMGDINAAAVCFSSSRSLFFTPREAEIYNKSKCTVIIRLLNFLTTLLANNAKDGLKVIPASIWSDNLWDLLLACTVRPGSVGFNVGDVEIMMNLPQEIETVLKVFSKSLPIKTVDDFKNHIHRALEAPQSVFSNLPVYLTDPETDHLGVQQMFCGCGYLHKAGLLSTLMTGKNRYLHQQLFDNVLQSVIQKIGDKKKALILSPLAQQAARSMLQLSFQLGLPAQTLVDTLLDKTRIEGASRDMEQCLGELVFTVFKDGICLQIADSATDVLPLLASRATPDGMRVCSILIATLDALSRDRALRKKQGSQMSLSLLKQWSRLSIWWDKAASLEQHSMALLLLTKLLIIDSQVSSDTKHSAFSDVVAMYQCMLTDTRTGLAFKCRALDLLPFFCTMPECEIHKLKSILDRLIADNFPLKSCEFVKGSPKYNDYTMALDKILSALELSGSLMLLEIVISILCRELKHVYEEHIQNALTRFIKRLPSAKHKAAISIPFTIFKKEGSFPNEIRRSAIDKVTVPLLRLAQKAALLEFYTENICWIMNVIEEKPAKGGESALEGQLMNKMCCFHLMELLYSRLNKDELNSAASRVNEHYCKGNNKKAESGKELTQAITKAAHLMKSEDMRGETQLLELRRQLHCAAYNTLIAVISCTQRELKFYIGFLFTDKEAKGQFLLSNLINADRKYEFPLELTEPLQRKKRFVSIRTEGADIVETPGSSDSPESPIITDVTPSFHLASQYLVDSSLSEDLNQYDFSTTSGFQSMSGRAPDKTRSRLLQRGSYSNDKTGQVTEVSISENFVELELDDLNQHECMAPLIALLTHMDRHNITPQIKRGEAVNEMPGWMRYLHEKMADITTSLNMRLFIAKLIINATEVFQPYAKFWFKSLMMLIVRGHLGTEGINYFIVDTVVTMLSWHNTAIPADTGEEKGLVSRLVEILMRHTFSESRPVFKNNLEMIRTLLHCWKARLEDIPYRVIYEQFKSSDPKSKQAATGVQLLGVVLANKMSPYGPSAPVDREKYFSSLANNMGHAHKAVYAATAEVIGMTFKHLAQMDGETETSLHNFVSAMLTSLKSTKPDHFIICVHGMHKHYADIADRFLSKLLFMLPSLHGEFCSLCLEVILSRVDKIDNVFLELKHKGLHKFLETRNETVQLLSLKIVKAIMVKLKREELQSLMPLLVPFVNSSSSMCRFTMYEILMWVYDNYRDDDSAEGHAIIGQTKDCLLRGLADSDLHCRIQLQNFWSSETRLPGSTLDRLVAMLEAMYTPATETHYLSYATNLLLEMTSKSPDYQREVFEHPLSECSFQDYSVHASWKQRHIAMTPLFASTQMSQSQGGDMMSFATHDTTDGQIRATQDVQQFSATQDVGGGDGHAPFNWLTQSSLDTFTDIGSVLPETASSLLFTVGQGSGASSRSAKMAKRWPIQPVGPGFGQGPLKAPIAGNAASSRSADNVDGVEDSQGREILRLKRRFLKDQESSRIFFARRAVKENRMREELRQEQRARREHEVTMYRKYRIGDLPDIQIKHSYLIAPLQAVAQRDSTVAKLLFSSLFCGIFDEMDSVKTDKEIQDIVGQINSSLETMMSGSMQYYPPFISCMLDIVHQLPKHLTVDPSAVGTCTITSSLQPLGIVVMEGQLIVQGSEESRNSKRRKLSVPSTSVSQDVALWLELARLYKSVNEYDVLRGVFSGKIQTKDITIKALEAEARGDFAQAFKLYDEALTCEDWQDGSKAQQAEIDLWEDCQMQCCEQLCQWSQLERLSVQGIDPNTRQPSLANIWEDTYYQEHYLPYLLKSKLKLLMDGSEDQQSLLDFIDTSMKVPEQKAVLENRYCEELSLLYLWQEDYDRARHYSRMATELFLQEWVSTDELIVSSRVVKLQTLQKLTELSEFLAFIENEQNFSVVTPAECLIDRWCRRTPDLLLDPVNIWDDVVCNRNVYIDHITTRLSGQCQNNSEMDTDDVSDLFLEAKLKLKLSMADAAQEQSNFSLALKILKDTHKMCKNISGDKLLIEWSQHYSRTHLRKAIGVMTEWKDDTVTSLLTAIDQLNKYTSSPVLTSKSTRARRHAELQGEIKQLLFMTCAQTNLLDQANIKAKLQNLLGLQASRPNQEILGKLIEQAHCHFKTAVTLEPDIQSTTLNDAFSNGSGYAHIKMAVFCDKCLRLTEDENHITLQSSITKQFPETVVMSFLTAMRLGSTEAQQWFPRLLQLAEFYPDSINIIADKSSAVPSWMFISWVSQMMAIMDTPEAPAVHNILLTLAAEYPQAVIYPFKISSDGFVFKNDQVSKKNKDVMGRLSVLLNDEHVPLVSKFVSALEQFTQPDMIFKDWADDVKLHLGKKPCNKEHIIVLFLQMYEKLAEQRGSADSVDSGHRSKEDTQTLSSGVAMGDYRRRFAQKYLKELETAFGKDGRKLAGMSAADFSPKCSKLHPGMRQMVAKPPGQLREYCQWMSEYNYMNQRGLLEIPGQYHGKAKPLPEYHVKVAGFDQRVLVMSSLRKPKRITIRGNDEKEYKFLVKGGEDLRQDQRIEQLFEIMNDIFSRDPACRHRKLSLTTYQVVPMTPRVGLIEWLNNTQPLKDFLQGAMTKQEATLYNDKDKGPRMQHDKWTGRFGGGDDLGQIYRNVYTKYSKSDTVQEFKLKQGKIPWDLSRRAFQKMSTSPEAFHVLRCHCAVTHALLSIAQYMLGIGDRHLSNFMIHLGTGRMVGIDFGHAFGSATQFLPVPELMPFRLTRQLRNLMLPLEEKGLMECTMEHGLRGLRNDCGLLLNTMDIFIKEPSVDWQQFAERQRRAGMGTDDVDTDTAWYPKQRVRFAQRKFMGDNPTYITCEELTLGHSKSPALPQMKRVVNGDVHDNIRAGLPEHGLSVEQQVAALIDQCTDMNLLGRVYTGWEAWM